MVIEGFSTVTEDFSESNTLTCVLPFPVIVYHNKLKEFSLYCCWPLYSLRASESTCESIPMHRCVEFIILCMVGSWSSIEALVTFRGT